MDNGQEQSFLNLYVIDEIHEHTYYDTIRKYAVDKPTFERYFPNWNHNGNSKQKLQPRRKRHD